jgi:hypothetical protein
MQVAIATKNLAILETAVLTFIWTSTEQQSETQRSKDHGSAIVSCHSYVHNLHSMHIQECVQKAMVKYDREMLQT